MGWIKRTTKESKKITNSSIPTTQKQYPLYISRINKFKQEIDKHNIIKWNFNDMKINDNIKLDKLMYLNKFKPITYYKLNNNNNQQQAKYIYDNSKLNNEKYIKYEICKNISHKLKNYYDIKRNWSFQ